MSLKLLQNSYDSDPELENDNETVSRINGNVHLELTDSPKEDKGRNKFPKLWNRMESSGDTKPKTKVKTDKLPLPAELQNMFSSKRQEEDPTLHDGRIRSFPHMRGNWASFVHISLNNSEGVHRQMELIKSVMKDFPDCGINFCEDLHISLSKTLPFRHHWIDSFIQDLKEKLANLHKFSLVFQSFQFYTNDEKTRTFLAMDVHPSQTLFELVNICDRSLAEYELDSYYEDPSFHVSLCWTLGDESSFLNKSVIPLLNAKWKTICDNDSAFQVQSVDSVQFKTGNKYCNFALS